MSFVSYAQNYEDVILFRALRDVERGFYIDVGAQDPVKDSVTRAFYDRKWRGMNVEPTEEYAQKLRQDRPEDINLQIALGSSEGELTFYEFPNEGLSTSSQEYAERHQAAGFPMRKRVVKCLTLDGVCAEHKITDVHFLKVDVEGAEVEVLKGFSFDTVRPWILVIEATEPMSTIAAYEDWESYVLGKHYVFVYADGLNRFYLAKEHLDLKPHFDFPPNCFDRFVTYPVTQMQRELEQLRGAVGQDQAALAKRVHEQDGQLAELRQTVKNLYASRLGPLEKPARAVLKAVRKIKGKIQSKKPRQKSAARQIMKKAGQGARTVSVPLLRRMKQKWRLRQRMIGAVQYLASIYWLRRLARRILSKYPPLYNLAIRVCGKSCMQTVTGRGLLSRFKEASFSFLLHMPVVNRFCRHPDFNARFGKLCSVKPAELNRLPPAAHPVYARLCARVNQVRLGAPP